jgi:hypothetical protein
LFGGQPLRLAFFVFKSISRDDFHGGAEFFVDSLIKCVITCPTKVTAYRLHGNPLHIFATA